MDVNHGLLNAMGVSLPLLEELVHLARERGALGAKITGAGLGGSIIALVREKDAEKVYHALLERARNAYVLELGVKGLTLQEGSN